MAYYVILALMQRGTITISNFGYQNFMKRKCIMKRIFDLRLKIIYQNRFVGFHKKCISIILFKIYQNI